MPSYRLLAAGFALLVAVMLLSGCASTPTPTRTVRLAVLDGVMEAGASETRRSVEGWWFGSRNRFDDGNATSTLGEVLTREFAGIPGVDVHPRSDVQALMTEKHHLLRRAYPSLTAEEREQLLGEQSPPDFGRALNVDFVLFPRVRESRMVHQKTFNWWYGRGDVRLELWDVRSGDLVWSWEGRDSDAFASQYGVMRDLARQARRQAVKRDAFGIY